MATPTISLRDDQLALLRRVALHRAETTGGRMSVSAVVQRLVDDARFQLETEALR